MVVCDRELSNFLIESVSLEFEFRTSLGTSILLSTSSITFGDILDADVTFTSWHVWRVSKS